MQELIQHFTKSCCQYIMLWFDSWYEGIKQDSSTASNGLKKHWKKFIPRITYKDLKRTKRAFLGLVQFVQMHHPQVQIIPKTMCQDDVENYFSLQRARVPGGKPTTLQFFESYASLTKEMLITSEMKDHMIWQCFQILSLFLLVNT